jgi:hypothetical protein
VTAQPHRRPRPLACQSRRGSARSAPLPALSVLCLLAAGAAPLLGGCKRAAQPAPPAKTEIATAEARLRSWTGTVEIERAGAITPATAEAPLHAGDLVRTAAESDAHLAFASGQTVHLGPRTLLRLGRDASSSLELTVIVGQADVEGAASGTGLQIASPGGPLRLTPGSKLRIKAQPDRTRYEVLVGRASLTGGDGGEVALRSGEGLAIAIGGSVLERYHVQLGPSEVERAEGDPAPATETATAAPDAGPPSQNRGGQASDRSATASTPGAVDLTLPVGETATVHTEGHTTTTIRMRLPADCAAPAVLRGLPKAASVASAPDDPASLHVRLPAGQFAYRLLCAGAPSGHGSLTLRTDSAVAPLPRKPPHNRLDADGRRYTVLFQNLLPAFELTWPRPPAAPRYVLNLETAGKTRTLPAPTATLELRSGTLSEGEHTWWWTTPDGRRSPTTTLAIKFDNATIAAEIQTPRPRASAASPGDELPPGSLDVAGTTLPGSRVTVDDQILPVDAQGRFRAAVPAPADGRRALSIRIEHRRTGIQYYLRRISAR